MNIRCDFYDISEKEFCQLSFEVDGALLKRERGILVYANDPNAFEALGYVVPENSKLNYVEAEIGNKVYSIADVSGNIKFTTHGASVTFVSPE